MANFTYTARNASGELTSGNLEATDASSVAHILLGRKFTPIEIKEAKASTNTSLDMSLFTPKIKLEDLIIFSRQMFSLTKSGIPIIRSVKGLADTASSERMTVILNDVCDQLERGRTLSSAMHRHNKVFGQLFVSIVHVGENTGRLDEAFQQLSDYLEREQETRKQIKPLPVILLLSYSRWSLL